MEWNTVTLRVKRGHRRAPCNERPKILHFQTGLCSSTPGREMPKFRVKMEGKRWGEMRGWREKCVGGRGEGEREIKREWRGEMMKRNQWWGWKLMKANKGRWKKWVKCEIERKMNIDAKKRVVKLKSNMKKNGSEEEIGKKEQR